MSFFPFFKLLTNHFFMFFCHFSSLFGLYYVSPCNFCPSSPKHTCILICLFSICGSGKKKPTFILFALFLCISLKYSLSLLDTNLIHLHAALLVLLCGPSFNPLPPAHCTSIAMCEVSVMNFTFLIYICLMFVCAVICPSQLWRTLLTVTAILVFHIFQSCITVASNNTTSKQQQE